MKNVGILILVVGLFIAVFTGFNFVTKKKVVEIGNLEIIQDKQHGTTWSPLIGFAVMAIGGGILLYNAKRK